MVWKEKKIHDPGILYGILEGSTVHCNTGRTGARCLHLGFHPEKQDTEVGMSCAYKWISSLHVCHFAHYWCAATGAEGGEIVMKDSELHSED